MHTTYCVSCRNEITFTNEAKMGTQVICSECGAELEVVWLDPIELDWPFGDWDDDEDDEYYDEDD